jgi:hypothetical protein
MHCGAVNSLVNDSIADLTMGNPTLYREQGENEQKSRAFSETLAQLLLTVLSFVHLDGWAEFKPK